MTQTNNVIEGNLTSNCILSFTNHLSCLKALLFILLSALYIDSHAQHDTTSMDTNNSQQKRTIKWDIGVLNMQQVPIKNFNNYSDPLVANFPKELILARRGDDHGLRDIWDLQNDFATDNPLYHGTFALDFQVEATVDNWFNIQIRSVIEHRGLSFGVYNVDNIAIYPQINLGIIKSWKLGLDSLSLNAHWGNFNDLKAAEGLTIYNLDVTGFKVEARYKKWIIEQLQIHDLQRGIGLNIDDVYHTTLRYRSEFGKTEMNNGLTHSLNFPTGNVGNSDKLLNNLDYHISVTNSHFRAYGQISYRYQTNDNEGSNRERLAGLLGFELNKQYPKFSIKIRNEYRLYGRYYHPGFINTNVYYRNQDFQYGNFIGPNLYPMHRFNRRFSQWAVFTEYRDHQVGGISMECKGRVPITKRFSLGFDIDFNWIFSDFTAPFLYPFYEVGAQYNYNDYSFAIGVSNKGMNLDKHYPTFYAFNSPVVLIRFEKKIGAFSSRLKSY